jgi:hypothetical protein
MDKGAGNSDVELVDKALAAALQDKEAGTPITVDMLMQSPEGLALVSCCQVLLPLPLPLRAPLPGMLAMASLALESQVWIACPACLAVGKVSHSFAAVLSVGHKCPETYTSRETHKLPRDTHKCPKMPSIQRCIQFVHMCIHGEREAREEGRSEAADPVMRPTLTIL